MDFEEELRSRLRTVSDTEVDLTELTTGGVAHGKRLIRRRRITQVTAAGATLVVLGGIVAYADGPWQKPPADLGVAATPSIGRQIDITPQAALKILLELLPTDARTGHYSGGDATSKSEIKSPAVWAHASYTDAVGTSNLMLSVGRFPRESCTPARQDEQCTQSTLPDGSVLTIVKISNSNDPSQWAWRASVDRGDGLHVNLIEDNSEQDKGPGTRPTPPLSTERLRAIVTSPRWQLKVDESFAQQAAPLFRPTPAAPVSTPPPTHS